MPGPKKAKLPPVPKPRKGKGTAAPSPHQPKGESPDAGPDLSHIAEGLRSLAVPLADLAFMTGNAVTHPDDQVAEIRASLRRFGQVEPLVVNRRESPRAVIGGNGRLQAMLAEGWTHAAVTVVDLPRDRANALSIALNRTSDGRTWDKAALAELLQDIDTGNDETIDRMLADLAAEVGIVPADELPSEPVTRSAHEKAKVICPACGHEFANDE